MKGKYVVDIFLSMMQFGIVFSMTYFILKNIKSVLDEIFEIDIHVLYIGIASFFVIFPLCLVRRIEKFAFTFIIADFLILITTIVIIVYASIHISEKKVWGDGVDLINKSTWLTMIGSAVFSFEGIGVILPIVEVMEEPKKFPKVLLAVLTTTMVLYTGFGQFCLFVYGSELNDKPLITENLP